MKFRIVKTRMAKYRAEILKRGGLFRRAKWETVWCYPNSHIPQEYFTVEEAEREIERYRDELDKKDVQEVIVKYIN